MASIILGAAGSAVGGSLGSAVIGSAVGRALGGVLDSAIFGGDGIHREGARLEELSVQTSTYGKMIPVVFGSARIAGNIIWSRPIKEIAETTETSVGGKAGGGTTASSTQYSYYVSLAIAICEGEIDEVLRVWADSQLLDLSQGTYRIYNGSEDQLPDSYIESFEGVGSTPAYRGLAYVVVEDFPLGAFGNRIPNFTFEVKRKVLSDDYDGQSLEEMVTSMILIPGSGEFVYDDTVQYKLAGTDLGGGNFAQSGFQQAINYHNTTGQANGLVALDQLLDPCPNLEWIGLVVTWFGDNLDAGICEIQPGVEFQGGATTQPDIWQVGSYTRDTARQITLVDGSPRYGGTPDDTALLRYIADITSRGLKVMLFPMFFMDVDNKPWRGRVTGSAADVASFFTKTNGYNDFITHYATLTAGAVDAFVIGSELVGLTQVNDGASVNRQFPAVNALVSLASTVRGIMGSAVKLTYAADWSEYHHSDGGWYHMDPLWASSNIDFVGIDAYFPLTDRPQNNDYDLQEVIDGWTSGEGYDWYYSDAGRTTQTALSAPYAWKNIGWWWSNTHTNPDGNPTGWTPESKKIWFTEYGFPSVDGATNQPNVFYDPTSSESFFPYHSLGQVDNRAQRLGLTATEVKWAGSAMIEQKFIWTWDARPYPMWPDLRSVWNDGGLWRTGHWVNGKLGISGLAAIVAELCTRAGLDTAAVDVSRLIGHVDGFVLTRQQTVRQAIEQLQGGYFFDAVESDNALKFVMRGGEPALTITNDELLPQGGGQAKSLLTITRAQEVELPQQVSVIYLNKNALYQPGHQLAQRQNSDSQEKISLNLPIVMEASQAQQIAEVSLYTGWMGRTQFTCELPPRYIGLEPTDIILVDDGDTLHEIRLTHTTLGRGNALRVRGVAEDVSTYNAYAEPDGAEATLPPQDIAATNLTFLDIAHLPGDDAGQGVMRLASSPLAQNWSGAVVYRSADSGQNYNRVATATESAISGVAVTALGDANPAFFDYANNVTVNLLGAGELVNADELAVLNGANAALLGDEIIQFTTANLLTDGQYQLSGLLRGRMGTEWAMADHLAGERFVLLDSRLNRLEMPTSLIGLSRDYKAVSVGQTLGQTEAESFAYQGIALRPYAPVHISGARDASGNLTLAWVRRTRLDGQWGDGVDIPRNEEAEAYEVDILDGAEVVRTLSVTTPSASYSVAEQTTDFGSPQSSLSVQVYQLSAVVGRGFGGEGMV